MSYLLGSAGWLLVLLALLFLSGGLPRLWLRPPEPGHLDDVLLRLALGLGLWTVLLFALAALGLWHRQPIVTLCLAVTGLGIWIFRKIPLAGGTAEAGSDRQPGRGPIVLLATVLLVVAAGLWLHALRPDVATDADVYHLTVPRLWLEHGGFYRIPFNVYSLWPMATQLLYALAMVIDDYGLAKQLHFALGMLAAAVTFLLVQRERAAPSSTRAWAGTVAAALFLANPVVLFEIRVAYVDLAYAFLFGLAFLYLHRALERRSEGTSLLLAGLLGGLVATLKLNGFFAPLVLWLVWIGVVLGGRQARPARLLDGSLRLLLPSALLLAPWLVKSWLLTGNPVYPLFYGVFGGPEWSARLSEQHAAWQRSIGMGRDAVDLLLLPVRVILHGELGYATFDGAIARAWILLIPLALVVGRRDSLVRRALGASGLYFLFWALTSQQMRFLIPILPLLAAATGRALAIVAEKIRPGPRRALLWAGTVVAAGLLLHPAWLYLRQTPRLAHDLMRGGERLQELVVPPVYRYANEELSPDARLMLVNTNRAFFLHRPFVADSFFEASQLADQLRGLDREGVATRLDELGIDHLLIDRRDRGIAWPAGFLELVAEASAAGTLFVSPDERFTIVALDS